MFGHHTHRNEVQRLRDLLALLVRDGNEGVIDYEHVKCAEAFLDRLGGESVE